MKPDELVHLVEWFLGGAGALTVVIVGAVLFLLRVSFKLGHTARDIEKVAEEIKSVKANADQVPVLVTRMGTVEEAWRRTNSDMREIRRAVWGRSQPDFNGEE